MQVTQTSAWATGGAEEAGYWGGVNVVKICVDGEVLQIFGYQAGVH
jgi:hypothetical protein